MVDAKLRLKRGLAARCEHLNILLEFHQQVALFVRLLEYDPNPPVIYSTAVDSSADEQSQWDCYTALTQNDISANLLTTRDGECDYQETTANISELSSLCQILERVSRLLPSCLSVAEHLFSGAACNVNGEDNEFISARNDANESDLIKQEIVELTYEK